MEGPYSFFHVKTNSFCFDSDHEEDLSEEEKVYIRELIRLALEEFKDEDILHVLKESLELRFKICFSPFPSTPVFPEMSDSKGTLVFKVVCLCTGQKRCKTRAKRGTLCGSNCNPAF